jgi:hypothetical protein
MRRRLGLPRRLADTTARDALCRVPLDGVRAVLHRAVRAARRRKALDPESLPIQVVAPLARQWDAVVAAGKGYLFALKDEHRTMCKLADELLPSESR